MTWDAALMILGIASGCLLASRRLVHYFQLESYQFHGYRRTVCRRWASALEAGLSITLWCFLMTLLFGEAPLAHVLSGAGSLLVGGFWWQRYRSAKEKKPFHLTPRVKRLYACLGLVCLIGLLLLGSKAFLFPVLLPVWIALAALLAWPVERLIYELYFRDARK